MDMEHVKSLFEFAIEQQVVISVLLVALIGLERWGLGLFKSSWIYLYALSIPFCLLFINLPLEIKPEYSEAISRYLVTPSDYSTALITKHSAWFSSSMAVYWLGVAGLFTLTAWVHFKYKKALKLTPLITSQDADSIIESQPLDLKTAQNGSPGDSSSFLSERNPVIAIGQKVFTSEQISSPLVLGLWNYKMVVPADYQSRFGADSLALILEHEQVHIQRRDNLLNMLALSLVILFWFNPLAWLAYGSFRRLQELTCDERVLRNKSIEDKILYSKALLDCVTRTEVRMMAYSHYGDKNMMLQRLNLIKKSAKGSKLAKGTLMATLFAVVCTFAVAKQLGSGEEEYAMPTVRIEPMYPIEAAKAGISGHVVLKYDITPSGATKNIRIVSQEPEATFGKSAQKALAKWEYQSSKKGFKDVLVRLDFAMEQPQTSKDPIEQIHVAPQADKSAQ